MKDINFKQTEDTLFLEEEHIILREQVKKFVETEVKPVAQNWESNGFIPREVFKKMGTLGFLGITYPTEFGGSEMDVRGSVVFAEELGKSTFSGFAIASLVHTDMASVHLLNAGNLEQKEKYLSDIVSGNKISCVAVTEPNAGSDVKNIRTKAQKVGSKYIINGSKIFITNGVHADIYFVAAKTGDALQQSGSITMFIVKKDNPGLIVNKQLDKHGWRCSDTAELFFQDCEVEESDVLGALHKGFYAIMQNFQNERLVMGAMAMGEAQAAIDSTVEYVKQRDAFGGKLWEKQTVRHKLAELQSKVTAARYMVYGVANKVRLGIDVIKEVSMIKVLCGELVNKVMYTCLQLHGGTGYMTGTEIERLTRDARAQSIGGGATEVMLEEVAKRM